MMPPADGDMSQPTKQEIKRHIRPLSHASELARAGLLGDVVLEFSVFFAMCIAQLLSSISDFRTAS